MLLTRLNSRSIENPGVPLSDPSVWDGMAGSESGSGVRVTAETALTYSPVWRAVTLISRDVGRIPLYVYRRDGEGKRREGEHPAYRLLRYKPNPYMTAPVFWETMMMPAIMRGNSYAYIVRRRNNDPGEILPLPCDMVYPVRANGEVFYVYESSKEMRRLPASDVLHIRGVGDGMTGISVIEKARESLGLGIAAMRYGSRFFSNGGSQRVVLEAPNYLKDDSIKRLRESWERMHTGLHNAHRTAILENGLKANVLSMSHDDAQFLQTRQFEIREVANWFGVPPHKLGDTTRTSFASLEQENQGYLDEALDPWLTKIEAECWDKLLTEPQKQRDTHIVEFLRQALLRADMQARYSAYKTGVDGGWMTPNEVRSRENMNPVEAGDVFMRPLNTQYVDLDGVPTLQATVAGAAGGDQGDSGDAADDRQARAAEALKTVVERSIRRAATYLANRVQAASKAQAELATWLDEDLPKLRSNVRENLEGEIAAVSAITGVERDVEVVLDDLFANVRTLALHAMEGRAETLKRRTYAAVSELADTFGQRVAVEMLNRGGYAAQERTDDNAE